MKRSAQIDATVSELTKHGATFLRTEQNKHIRVFFRYQDQERFVIVAATSSDSRRGIDNARAAVRRELGIQRFRVTGKRRRHRNYADRPAPTAPEHITLGRDPWSGIQGTPIARAAASIAADRAWAQLFGLCLLNQNHVPQSPAIRQAIGLGA